MSANFWHLILGLVAALVGTLSLGFGMYRWVSLLVIGFVNVYSMAVLLECAIRSDQTCPKAEAEVVFCTSGSNLEFASIIVSRRCLGFRLCEFIR